MPAFAPGRVGDGELRIEPVTSDRVAALLQFLSAEYADQPSTALRFVGESGAARWRWLYEEYPIRAEDHVPAWICLEEDRIVGHLGALPVEIVVRGEPRTMAWARDLIVARSMRGRGIGSRLMRMLPDLFGHAGVLGYEDTYGLYRRIGYEDVGTVPTYLKVRRPRAFAAAFLSSRMASALAAPLLRVAQMRMPHRGGSKVQVEQLGDFDARFDRFWRSIEPDLGSVVRRTSATMRWRYLRNPTAQYRVLAAVSGAEVLGIAVARSGRSHGVRIGIITELLTHPADRNTMRALIDAAERSLDEAASEPIVFVRTAVRGSTYGRELLRAGYLPSPSRIHCIMTGRAALTDEGGNGARDWYLNAGDSDVDFL